jgi:hypothetical protein
MAALAAEKAERVEKPTEDDDGGEQQCPRVSCATSSLSSGEMS